MNLRLYQFKLLRPYIDNAVANSIYKQTIIPLMDYADFMIESSSLTQINRLEKLQEKAIKYIDNNAHSTLQYNDLCNLYGLQPLRMEATCLICYGQAK